METAGASPSPLILPTVKLNAVSSRPTVERFGTESAFLLGGFLGVLKEDLEKRGMMCRRRETFTLQDLCLRLWTLRRTSVVGIQLLWQYEHNVLNMRCQLKYRNKKQVRVKKRTRCRRWALRWWAYFSYLGCPLDRYQTTLLAMSTWGRLRTCSGGSMAVPTQMCPESSYH